MPIYEYRCRYCLYKFQLLQGINDSPPVVCPNCGKKGGIKKLVSEVLFELKGSGWYATDYKNNNISQSKGIKSEGSNGRKLKTMNESKEEKESG